MATVYIKTNGTGNPKNTTDNLESALKMFKRKLNDEKLSWELKRREEYMKPGVKKRKKREQAAIARRKLENKAKKRK